jgi:hypothetical protein
MAILTLALESGFKHFLGYLMGCQKPGFYDSFGGVREIVERNPVS